MSERMKNHDEVEFLRDSESSFSNIKDFEHKPRYQIVNGFRMAYIDEGDGSAGTYLLLRGEPAWSYLYRRMIPVLVNAGFRCIAPDLIGFGRSDKPLERSAYTYANHLAWVTEFVHALDLDHLSMFAQDWGGLLGLRLLVAEEHRFLRVAIGNTALPVGESLGDGFDQWLHFSQSDAFSVGGLFSRAVRARTLSALEVNGYQAPFPTREHEAGVRAFPTLVPITNEHAQVEENKAAWEKLKSFEKPFLTLWGSADVVFGEERHQQIFTSQIPGASGQPHRVFEQAGHFIQDDCGEEIAAILVEWSQR